MAEHLIVNLEEFAELCFVTPETMRGYIRSADDREAWLIKRGSRGKDYEIEAHGGLAWWNALREKEDATDAERQAQLQQLRLNLGVGSVEPTETLNLSGRQRREEYGAAFEALKLRRAMGELTVVADIEHELSQAVVSLRRRLQRVPGEFVIAHGLDQALVRPLKDAISRALRDFVAGIKVVEVVDVDPE